MDATLAARIARHAHTLDPAGLDAVARDAGQPGWLDLIPDLDFGSSSTGGGCVMLVAGLPGPGVLQVGITDGEAGLPETTDTFWLGILDEDGEPLLEVVSPPLGGS